MMSMPARAIGAFLVDFRPSFLLITAYGVRMLIKRLSRNIDVFPCFGLFSRATTSSAVRINLLQAAI